MIAPSGEQIEIVHGNQRAVVVEVGGGLREYRAGDRALLDGYPLDAMCSDGRGQVLIPWPNRVRDGSYEFDGQRNQLALTEPANGNAIHGLARWSAWSVGDRRRNRVVMSHLLRPQPGYPHSLAIDIEYALSDAGLAVHTQARNVGAQRCPFGAGAHPYLSAGPAPVDGIVLRVPALTVLDSDERGIPIGSSPVAGTPRDFSRPRPIGDTVLDHAFSELERGDDGRARVELNDPRAGTTLTLWVDEAYPYLMVFTGDSLPEGARRSLAVEPMTCPPDALRSGEALIVLEPGESFSGRWGISPSQGARA